MDAFFLDEGFGSLDSDHLDKAMAGIERLVAESEQRLVVVVSHVAAMRDAGGVSLIVVTNRDHERQTRELAQGFGARIAASANDAPLLSGPVDLILRAGDEPFEGARVIEFEGLKSPGEIVRPAQSMRSAGRLRVGPTSMILSPSMRTTPFRIGSSVGLT